MHNTEYDLGSASGLQRPASHLDYSLTGDNAKRAIEKGLAEAEWYQCHVPKAEMRKLLSRKDGPALRDTAVWFILIIGFALLTVTWWGNWYAVLPFLCYAVLYASTSDSRWHESSHGTAFKTDWMNNVLYEISSFMVMRESIVWRWSHTRHHSDTIIVGRDPEITVPRPPNLKALFLSFFNLPVYPKYFKHLIIHSIGKVTNEEKTFIPETEFSKLFLRARIYLLIYLAVIFISLITGSILPILLIGGANLFGAWLMPVYGYTQHAGLAENVLDHRLNCRTVYMNPINRFLYWNMNYHVEHHMFPLVPYHALPKLHAIVREDMPAPYTSLLSAWKEIIPAVLRQVKDPSYYVKRKLPKAKATTQKEKFTSEAKIDKEGWIKACLSSDLGTEDVVRFDYEKQTFAIYKTQDGSLYATDGMCTHGNAHLANGLVKGGIIECAKHNGRFNLKDGSPARTPICKGLATYPIEDRNGDIYINVDRAGGDGAKKEQTFELQVISTRNVSTFIREVTLQPLGENIKFTPGDYIQIKIPQYEKISFADFKIEEPYTSVWERHKLFDLEVSNEESNVKNNYSLVGKVGGENTVTLNVRIATPPPGQDCPPGIGSSYIFNLKADDIVSAVGPYGDFHIKPTLKEMVYIGGGAGMGPLRAHIEHLLEKENSNRKISFWYGARSKQEIFYEDYFISLSEKYDNFSFEIALSDPLPEDNWQGKTGFIHEAVYLNQLKNHKNPKDIEYYLCGPPMMIAACKKTLTELGVDEKDIANDAF